MRCYAKLRRLLLAALLCLTQTTAFGAEIGLRNPRLSSSDEGYAISAEFNVSFNPRLEAAVNKGIVLYFVVEFELSRPRWYWLDEQIVRKSRTYQLSFHALTRQYRLSTGALHQGFATLDEALEVISRLRNWQVIDKAEIKADQTYVAGLRMRLDLSQMPKTFQVSALSSRDWNLSSDWVRWTLTSAESGGAAAVTNAGGSISEAGDAK